MLFLHVPTPAPEMAPKHEAAAFGAHSRIWAVRTLDHFVVFPQLWFPTYLCIMCRSCIHLPLCPLQGCADCHHNTFCGREMCAAPATVSLKVGLELTVCALNRQKAILAERFVLLWRKLHVVGEVGLPMKHGHEERTQVQVLYCYVDTAAKVPV